MIGEELSDKERGGWTAMAREASRYEEKDATTTQGGGLGLTPLKTVSCSTLLANMIQK